MSLPAANQPFALFWDHGLNGALLFQHPCGELRGTDTQAALAQLRAAALRGEWVAGGFSYEAGHLLEPRLATAMRGPPFHWFGRFQNARFLPHAEAIALIGGWRAPVSIGAPQPLVAKADWVRVAEQVLHYIAAGDIYQANLSFQAQVPMRGHPAAIFARLFRPEVAPHGALVHDGAGQWWISLSPELFFRLDGNSLTARPMKGTSQRGATVGEDAAFASALAADPKNRAENLMITDLLRNDLSRVAETGSVSVERLFAIESYPTVHQMTSTITARLAAGRDAVDALTALFPCGSITGAPKIRAMEIIHELEDRPRGIYCGSMGWVAPGAAQAQFNVAIRTLSLTGGIAHLGLGAGIVADSSPEAEWAECLTKARFLQPALPSALIETMRHEADGTIPRLPLHLSRLQASARRFGFRFDSATLQERLAIPGAGHPRRVRLLLDREGRAAVQLSPLPPVPGGPVQVAVRPLPVATDDWRLAHKTSDRAFLDDARLASGAFECLFVRPDGKLTEGSFTSIFVERDGLLLTPPAYLGLLQGVLRAELLATGRAIEAELTADDLGSGFFIGNSLRGLLRATAA